MIVPVRGDRMGHPLAHLDALLDQPLDLHRIVGQQAHAPDAEMAQHDRGGLERALVGLEAELPVGIQGVEALVLQLVGAQLVDQADAAALVGR